MAKLELGRQRRKNDGCTCIFKLPAYPTGINGKVIGEEKSGEDTKLTANFKVPYQPGVLKAIAIKDGKEVASKQLSTTGKPAKIKLIADRSIINANRNDLSYVRIATTDSRTQAIP